MTSLLTSTRQLSRDTGYFIPVGNLKGLIYEYNPVLGVSSAAAWADTNHSTLMFISSAGAGILKDMGRTIVSSSRVFRKVQLVFSTANTVALAAQGITTTVGGGAAGQTSTGGSPGVGEDYLTGYIELGFNGGRPAPVAVYGR